VGKTDFLPSSGVEIKNNGAVLPLPQYTFIAWTGANLETVQYNSTYPDVAYLDRLGRLGKFVEKSTKQTCLEIVSYRIKYSTVLRLLELQIRRGRKD
jgi:hypothetical protein